MMSAQMAAQPSVRPAPRALSKKRTANSDRPEFSPYQTAQMPMAMA